MATHQPDHATSSRDAPARWSELLNSPDLTVTLRGLVIAAQHHTDHIWSLAARRDLPDPTATATGARGEAWCRLALHTYEYLRDTGAYAHLSAEDPNRYLVRAGQVLAWLSAAVDSTGERFADTYGIDDTFRLDGDDMHDRIQMLVQQAQSDGVLAVTGHRVELWQVADEGFLLTVDPPTPPRLCSHHIEARQLLPDRTSGSVAAVAVLMATGNAANLLLDEQARLQQAARISATNPALALRHPITPAPRPATGLPGPTPTQTAGPGAPPAMPRRRSR
jgi:hypothetical protein